MRAALTSLIKTSSGEYIFFVRHYARSGLANDDLLVFHFGSTPVERNAQTLDLCELKPPLGTIRIVPNGSLSVFIWVQKWLGADLDRKVSK